MYKNLMVATGMLSLLATHSSANPSLNREDSVLQSPKQENQGFIPPAAAKKAGVFDFEKIHDYKIDHGPNKGKVAPIYGLRIRIPGKNVEIEKFKKKFALSNQEMNAINSLPEQEKEKKIAEWYEEFYKKMEKEKTLIHEICNNSFIGDDWEYGFFDPECYDTYLSEADFLLGFYIPGEDSNKDPIILVHGGPQGDGESMVDMGVELSKKTGRSILAYSQRGCSGSGLMFDLTKDGFQQSAQDLDKVIDATLALSGKKKVALLGHSLGTTLVNEYLGTMDKGKVSSYIAAGPAETDLASYARMFVKRKASELNNSSLINNLRSEINLRLEKMKTEEALDEAELQKKLDDSVDQQLIQNFTNTRFSNFDNAKDFYKRIVQSEEFLLLRNKIKCYISKKLFTETISLLHLDLYKKLKDPKGHQMLKNIKVPTLIIAGEHDSVDPKSARITADRIPHSQLHVMKDTAHWMYREKPEEFYPLVQSFLDRVDAGEKIGTGKTVQAGKKGKKNGTRKVKNLGSVRKKTRIQDKSAPAA